MAYGTTAEQVRDKVAGAADAAREKAADLAGAARERAAGLAGQALDATAPARERAAEVAGHARERASELAGAVSAGAGAVRSRIQGAVGGTPRADVFGGAALGDGEYRAPATDPLSRLKGGARSVASGARGAGTGFEHRYDERPLQTLLIAGIAGFVIGRLLR
jgi:hypothetical protein